jgi:hypothetical protein
MHIALRQEEEEKKNVQNPRSAIDMIKMKIEEDKRKK